VPRNARGAKPPEECASIEDVRRSIDALDREIVALIGERSRYVEAAAKFKADEAGVRAPERQRAMLEERRRWAEEEGLSLEVIEDLFRRLVSYFVGREMEDWKGGDQAGG
jgi:isochorismate pyruvate lyase